MQLGQNSVRCHLISPQVNTDIKYSLLLSLVRLLWFFVGSACHNIPRNGTTTVAAPVPPGILFRNHHHLPLLLQRTRRSPPLQVSTFIEYSSFECHAIKCSTFKCSARLESGIFFDFTTSEQHHQVVCGGKSEEGQYGLDWQTPAGLEVCEIYHGWTEGEVQCAEE